MVNAIAEHVREERPVICYGACHYCCKVHAAAKATLTGIPSIPRIFGRNPTRGTCLHIYESPSCPRVDFSDMFPPYFFLRHLFGHFGIAANDLRLVRPKPNKPFSFGTHLYDGVYQHFVRLPLCVAGVSLHCIGGALPGREKNGFSPQGFVPK